MLFERLCELPECFQLIYDIASESSKKEDAYIQALLI